MNFMETETVKTEKIVFGGNSIAKINSKTVFIPYSLPGETLLVNIVQHKNDYDNAEIVEILEPSPYRVKPECKYYGVCGGCNMMHISDAYQRELRKNMLIDAFKNNHIDISDKVEVIYSDNFNYRSRFQFMNGGLSVKSGNTIIPIDKCLCAENVVNEYLASTKPENRPKGRVHYFGSEKITEGNKVRTAVEIPKQEAPKPKMKNGKKLKIKENHYFAGTVYSPENSVTVKLNNKNISFDVRGFFQSNLKVFEKVLTLINNSLPGGENIVDMYSGCGSISAFLADKYKNVILVEHNRDALVYAEINMNGTKHTSYGLSGENWVKNCAQLCGKIDAVVVDPPRSGMEKAVCDYLCTSKIPFIRSLSCDPATHARDAARLIKAGYKLEKVYLLDFYPNTSHIESFCVFNIDECLI